MKAIQIITILVLVASINAYAGVTKKQKYNFSYEESNGVIDTATVCFEYKYGSLDYRKCRSYAVDLFKSKCSKNGKLAESYKYPESLRYVELRDKFCAAAGRMQ